MLLDTDVTHLGEGISGGVEVSRQENPKRVNSSMQGDLNCQHQEKDRAEEAYKPGKCYHPPSLTRACCIVWVRKSPAATVEPNLSPPGNGNKTLSKGTSTNILTSVIAALSL